MAALNSVWLYWAVPGRSGLHRAVEECTQVRAVLDFTVRYLAVVGCTRLYLAVLGCTGLYWAKLGCTR